MPRLALGLVPPAAPVHAAWNVPLVQAKDPQLAMAMGGRFPHEPVGPRRPMGVGLVAVRVATLALA